MKIIYSAIAMLFLAVTSKGQETIDTTHTRTDVLSPKKVDKQAEFTDGTMGWNLFLEKTLNPKVAIKAIPANDDQIKQTVFLEFVVNKTGEVSDIKVLNEVHPVLKEEAIRVIKLSPYWTPAQKDGKDVNTYQKAQIKFKARKFESTDSNSDESSNSGGGRTNRIKKGEKVN
jgi:hypothetical protein